MKGVQLFVQLPTTQPPPVPPVPEPPVPELPPVPLVGVQPDPLFVKPERQLKSH